MGESVGAFSLTEWARFGDVGVEQQAVYTTLAHVAEIDPAIGINIFVHEGHHVRDPGTLWHKLSL